MLGRAESYARLQVQMWTETGVVGLFGWSSAGIQIVGELLTIPEHRNDHQKIARPTAWYSWRWRQTARRTDLGFSLASLLQLFWLELRSGAYEQRVG